MTDQPFDPTMTDPSGASQPSEEELRAAYEAELKTLRIEDVMMQTVVSLLNLGARRAGLLPGSEDEVDPEQVRMAIEGARGLLTPLEPALGPNAASLKDALAQLQLAYTKLAGASAPPAMITSARRSAPRARCRPPSATRAISTPPAFRPIMSSATAFRGRKFRAARPTPCKKPIS